jgi:hypothetical protein
MMKKPSSRRRADRQRDVANGFCVSEPTPVDNAAGRRPRQATSAVIMMGRRRIKAAS